MIGNFFELVSDKFFHPLSNKNKVLNYRLLAIINEQMGGELGQWPRENVLDWIIDYISNCPIDFYDDDTDEDEGKDYRRIASNKLRYFVNCGWLVDENDTRTLKVTYQMDSAAIALLKAMQDVVDEDSSPSEYTSYVYNIYNSLYNFKYDHALEMVESMYSHSRDLTARLRGLNVSIKKYLQKLVNNPNLSPKEILDQFLIEYQDKVILKAFNNLRIKDNPAKYQNYIINKIDNLMLEDNLNKMIDDYIEKKRDGVKTPSNIAEAKEFFVSRLLYIDEQFKYIEDNIELLYKRNTAYAEAANSRIRFLLNEEVDIEGSIVSTLRNIANSGGDAVDGYGAFDIFELGRLTENSLYNQRARARKPASIIDDTSNIVVDEEVLKEARSRLKNEASFSHRSISAYILNQLGTRDKMEAKDMNIKAFDDLVKMFLACLYSQSRTVAYKIEFTGDVFTWDSGTRPIKMSNFIAERKK